MSILYYAIFIRIADKLKIYSKKEYINDIHELVLKG